MICSLRTLEIFKLECACEVYGDDVIIAALSIFPVGEGTSLSNYVKASLNELKKTGLTIQPGSMTTTIEASTLDDLFQAVKKAHDIQITMGAQRVYFVLAVDNRQDKNATMSTKLRAIDAESALERL
jgi:uncharacterized protein (TIGR00106 family)